MHSWLILAFALCSDAAVLEFAAQELPDSVTHTSDTHNSVMRKVQVAVNSDASIADTTVRTGSGATTNSRKDRLAKMMSDTVKPSKKKLASHMSKGMDYEKECPAEATLEQAFEKFDKSGTKIDAASLKVPDPDQVALREVVVMHITDGQATFDAHEKANPEVYRRANTFASMINDLAQSTKIPDSAFSLFLGVPADTYKTEDPPLGMMLTKGTPGDHILTLGVSLFSYAPWGKEPRDMLMKAQSAQEACGASCPKKAFAVFRGSNTGHGWEWNDQDATHQPIRKDGTLNPRYEAAMLSKKKPDLLDAGFHGHLDPVWSQKWSGVLESEGLMKEFLSDEEQATHYNAIVVIDGETLPDRLPKQLAYGLPVVLVRDSLAHNDIPMRWEDQEFWYPEMKSGEHYIKSTSADLEANLEHLRANPELAARIGKNGKTFVQENLSEKRLRCYMHNLLTMYANRQAK